MTKIENYYVVAMEECSEIQKAISKSMRFGLNDHHPNNPNSTNKYEILEEYYQLQAVIEWLKQFGGLDDLSKEEVGRIKVDKLKKVNKFMQYSLSSGFVHE